MRFDNNPVKREAQKLLFEDIKANCCLGLAGPDPEEYINILNEHCKSQILCDFEPTRDFVLKNSLCGAYDLNSSKIDWIDADFCSSILSNKNCIEYLYNQLIENKNEFYLTINISLRGSTRLDVIQFINKLFNNSTCQPNQFELIKKIEYPDKRYIHIHSGFHNIEKIIQYRDSGNHMFSFLIHIKNAKSVRVSRYINSLPLKYRKTPKQLIDWLENPSRGHCIPKFLKSAKYAIDHRDQVDTISYILECYNTSYEEIFNNCMKNRSKLMVETRRKKDNFYHHEEYSKQSNLNSLNKLKEFIKIKGHYPSCKETPSYQWANKFIKQFQEGYYKFEEAESIYLEIIQLKEQYKK